MAAKQLAKKQQTNEKNEQKKNYTRSDLPCSCYCCCCCYCCWSLILLTHQYWIERVQQRQRVDWNTILPLNLQLIDLKR